MKKFVKSKVFTDNSEIKPDTFYEFFAIVEHPDYKTGLAVVIYDESKSIKGYDSSFFE